MRRATVPIAFLAFYALIAPVGVAVMSPAPSQAGLVPAAARPALRVAPVSPSPESSLEQLAAARPGAQAARTLGTPDAPGPRPHTDTIVTGDSQWGIARQYGVPVESPAEANRLSLNSAVRAQKTTQLLARPAVPRGVTVAHIVAAGETIWKIAAAYGVRAEDLP